MASTFSPERRWPVLFGTAMVCAGLFLSTLHVSSAGAAGACRADPLVTLSNGMVLRLYADIANDPANIQQVTYELHGPVGTSALSADIPADDPLWGKEQFTYYADSKDTKFRNALQVATADGTKTKVTGYIDGTDNHGNPHTWKQGGDSTKIVTITADLGDMGEATPVGQPAPGKKVDQKHQDH